MTKELLNSLLRFSTDCASWIVGLLYHVDVAALSSSQTSELRVDASWPFVLDVGAWQTFLLVCLDFSFMLGLPLPSFDARSGVCLADWCLALLGRSGSFRHIICYLISQ